MLQHPSSKIQRKKTNSYRYNRMYKHTFSFLNKKNKFLSFIKEKLKKKEPRGWGFEYALYGADEHCFRNCWVLGPRISISRSPFTWAHTVDCWENLFLLSLCFHFPPWKCLWLGPKMHEGLLCWDKQSFATFVSLIPSWFYRFGRSHKLTDGQTLMSTHRTEGRSYNVVILKSTSADLQGIIILFLKLHHAQHSPWVPVETMSTFVTNKMSQNNN